jgi:hypothetical protein
MFKGSTPYEIQSTGLQLSLRPRLSGGCSVGGLSACLVAYHHRITLGYHHHQAGILQETRQVLVINSNFFSDPSWQSLCSKVYAVSQ